ncbi:MAG: glycosyltransferase family 39 protein [Lachnospiraceae bacterium]|nr:glycosyltransferase family 39 protein [Lachnospiraceae bacterium]
MDKTKTIDMTLKQKIYFVCSVILLLGMSIFLIKNASMQSFWSDEMSTLGYIRSDVSYFEMMKEYMVRDAVNLPLYPTILKFFYEIMPYGEVYLLIPSILFVICSILIIAVIGYKCGNEDISFLCICLGSISSGAICHAAWDIRSYSLLIMLSALTILFYVRRRENESIKNICLYGISMLLLFFTHWYGAIMMMGFAISDLVFWLQKKIKIKCIVSYLIAGVPLFIYLIIMLMNMRRDLSSHYGNPGLEGIKEALYLITGGRFLCVLLFITGCAGIVIIGIVKKEKIQAIWKVMLFSCIWTFGTTFFIKNGTFFAPKYFLVILPQVILIMAFTVDSILKEVFKKSNEWLKRYSVWFKSMIIVGMVLYFGKYIYQNYTSCYEFHMDERMPYRQTAEFLVDRGDIYREDTLLLSTDTHKITAAWLEYYFEKRGFTLPGRLIVYGDHIYRDGLESWGMFSEEEILQYDTIVLFRISMEITEDVQTFMDKYYQEEEGYFGDRVRMYRKIEN